MPQHHKCHFIDSNKHNIWLHPLLHSTKLFLTLLPFEYTLSMSTPILLHPIKLNSPWLTAVPCLTTPAYPTLLHMNTYHQSPLQLTFYPIQFHLNWLLHHLNTPYPTCFDIWPNYSFPPGYTSLNSTLPDCNWRNSTQPDWTLSNSTPTYYNLSNSSQHDYNVEVWMIVRVYSVVLRRTVVGVDLLTDVSTTWAEAIIRVASAQVVETSVNTNNSPS